MNDAHTTPADASALARPHSDDTNGEGESKPPTSARQFTSAVVKHPSPEGYSPIAQEEQSLPGCERCGTPFQPRPRRRFCSPGCKRRAKDSRRWAARAGGPVDRVCVVCGTDFSTLRPSAKYCGSRCSERAKYLRRKSV